MKKFTFLITTLLFVFSSCYIYKPYQFKEEETVVRQDNRSSLSLRTEMAGKKEKEDAENRRRSEEIQKEERLKTEQKAKLELESTDLTEDELQRKAEFENNERLALNKGKDAGEVSSKMESEMAMSGEDSLKIKIKPNLYYRIAADGEKYKIQADQWEGDTLVSHIIRKPEKVLRFHKNQIDPENLEERRFSKPFSDLITVGSYVTGGVIILLLVL